MKKEKRRYPRKSGRKTEVRCPRCQEKLDRWTKGKVIKEMINDLEDFKKT